MHIAKVLEHLERLERKTGDLYEWLSTVFADDPEAAGFFFRVSVDETAHANLIGYQRRLVTQNSRLFKDVSVDLEGLGEVLAKVDSLMSGTPPSLEEALKVALEIEGSAAEMHAFTTIEKASSTLSRLLQNLGSFDNRHRKDFEEFAAHRGFIPSAQSRSVPDAQMNPGLEAGTSDEEMVSIPPEALERLEYYYLWIEKLDYYRILGVRDYATPDQIRHAFRTLAHDFHPDAHMNCPTEIQQKFHEVFGRMTHAYTTLMTPAKRRAYDRTLSGRQRY